MCGLFEKRQERKDYKVTRKTITADRRKSMFPGNCKTVDGSVSTEVGIMDTSKGSLGRLTKFVFCPPSLPPTPPPTKEKNIQITISFFRGWKTTYSFILIPHFLCTIHLVQMSQLPWRNIKKNLANRIKKYVFIFARIRSTSPVYAKDLQIL